MTHHHFDMRAADEEARRASTYAIAIVAVGALVLSLVAFNASYDRLTDTEQNSIIWELETGR